MIILSCNKIKKSYGIDTILEDISFSINEGEKVGLVGANGAGKSTLFNILMGNTEEDSGELFTDKSKKLGYLSQHLSLTSDNTLFEEVLSVFSNLLNLEKKIKTLELKLNEPYDASKIDYQDKIISEFTTATDTYNNSGGFTYKGQIARVLKGLGFNEEDYLKKIDILSGGQKTRVALCKLLLESPDLLLLDEPTNHLDLAAIEWFEDYLKSYKGTIIIISHDRFFLDAVTNRTLELLKGKMDSYKGNYTAFVELRKKEYEVRAKAYALQQSEIKRQEEIIEKYLSFNREKSVKAAESRQKALDKVVRINLPTKDERASRINFETEVTSGNDVLHIENLKKSFGLKLLFQNVNLDIKRGSKIAIIGENGRGKTTIFKILMNFISQDDGSVYLGKNVVPGYYDQEQSNLNDEKTVLDEIWDDYPDLATTKLRSYLGAFLFSGDDVFKKISTLSGGEKCRINLLKLMLSKCNLLLLDEPTNHLDIVSREALEDSLLEYEGTVIVISHDRYFLNKVIDSIYELKEDELKEYLGNYSYYVEKKKNPERYQNIEENQGKSKTLIQEEKKKKREKEKVEKDSKQALKDLESEISTLEKRIAEFQQQLCLPEIYSDPDKSSETSKNIVISKDRLEELYAKWEELI